MSELSIKTSSDDYICNPLSSEQILSAKEYMKNQVEKTKTFKIVSNIIIPSS